MTFRIAFSLKRFEERINYRYKNGVPIGKWHGGGEIIMQTHTVVQKQILIMIIRINKTTK